MKIQLAQRTITNIGRLWRFFGEHRQRFTDGAGNDPVAFGALCADRSNEVVELVVGDGELGGLGFVTDVNRTGESTANVHVYIWDRRAMRNQDKLREFLAQFMESHGLHRLFAEAPAEHTLARRNIDRIGFNYVGIYRQRLMKDGSRRDLAMYDALAIDLAPEGG